jgi:hypothetical protein
MTSSRGWTSYNFAVLRVVPHVHTGVFMPVGVVLHARTQEFLGLRVITDPAALETRVADTDVELLVRYLDLTAGPIALAPPSERFHWLTAPRSDVIQSGPVHEGLSPDPAVTLDNLFATLVLAGQIPPSGKR